MTGPRTGAGGLDADLWAGWVEAQEGGFVVDADGALTFRHESIGHAVARDLLPIPRTRYHAALAKGLGGPPSAIAWHWLAAHDPAAARVAAIDAARFAAERHAAADELEALESALSLPDAPAPGSRRRSAPPSDRVDLGVRAAEAAYAVGRIPRATALPRGSHLRS